MRMATLGKCLLLAAAVVALLPTCHGQASCEGGPAELQEAGLRAKKYSFSASGSNPPPKMMLDDPAAFTLERSWDGGVPALDTSTLAWQDWVPDGAVGQGAQNSIVLAAGLLKFPHAGSYTLQVEGNDGFFVWLSRENPQGCMSNLTRPSSSLAVGDGCSFAAGHSNLANLTLLQCQSGACPGTESSSFSIASADVGKLFYLRVEYWDWATDGQSAFRLKLAGPGLALTSDLASAGYLGTADSCSACAPGRFFDEEGNACQACQRGRYQDVAGESSCKVCGAGLSTSSTGATGRCDCEGVRIMGSALFRSTFEFYGGSGHEAISSIATCGSSGDFVVLGTTSSPALSGVTTNGGEDVFLQRFSDEGTLRWTRVFGGSARDTSSGNYGQDGEVLACDDDGRIYFAMSESDLASVSVRRLGNDTDRAPSVEWQLSLDAPQASDSVAGLALDSVNERLVLLGSTRGTLPGQSSNGNWDAFVVGIRAANGSVAWTRQFGYSGDDQATALALDENGAIYAATLDSAAFRSHLWKFGAADGSAQWAYSVVGERCGALAPYHDARRLYAVCTTAPVEEEERVGRYRFHRFESTAALENTYECSASVSETCGAAYSNATNRNDFTYFCGLCSASTGVDPATCSPCCDATVCPQSSNVSTSEGYSGHANYEIYGAAVDPEEERLILGGLAWNAAGDAFYAYAAAHAIDSTVSGVADATASWTEEARIRPVGQPSSPLQHSKGSTGSVGGYTSLALNAGAVVLAGTAFAQFDTKVTASNGNDLDAVLRSVAASDGTSPPPRGTDACPRAAVYNETVPSLPKARLRHETYFPMMDDLLQEIGTPFAGSMRKLVHGTHAIWLGKDEEVSVPSQSEPDSSSYSLLVRPDRVPKTSRLARDICAMAVNCTALFPGDADNIAACEAKTGYPSYILPTEVFNDARLQHEASDAVQWQRGAYHMASGYVQCREVFDDDRTQLFYMDVYRGLASSSYSFASGEVRNPFVHNPTVLGSRLTGAKGWASNYERRTGSLADIYVPTFPDVTDSLEAFSTLQDGWQFPTTTTGMQPARKTASSTARAPAPAPLASAPTPPACRSAAAHTQETSRARQTA